MSCGQRFNVEDDQKSEIYKNHLDWHFRQNKKDKDDTKIARCKKWFYGTNVSHDNYRYCVGID